MLSPVQNSCASRVRTINFEQNQQVNATFFGGPTCVVPLLLVLLGPYMTVNYNKKWHAAAAHLSEPARSTKLSLPRVTFWVCRLVASMMTLMMR